MPAIHVEADLDEILPQDLADTGEETSSGKIVVTGMNSILKDSLGEFETPKMSQREGQSKPLDTSGIMHL